MSQITLTCAAVVTPGAVSAVSLSKAWGVDSVDITHYELGAGASDDEVEVCAADTLGDVKVLFIYAVDNSYPETVPGTPDITYKVNANTENAIPMSMPHLWHEHMLVGLDVAGLLPDSLFFSNANAAAIDLVVIAGRVNT